MGLSSALITIVFWLIIDFLHEQVKWSAKVVKGAGCSTGETTELANSYLSRLGPVTRNSHKAGMVIFV